MSVTFITTSKVFTPASHAIGVYQQHNATKISLFYETRKPSKGRPKRATAVRV